MAVACRIDRLVKRLSEVVTIAPEDTAEVAAAKMADNKVGCLIVIGAEGTAVGILTERDIISRVVSKSASPSLTRVADIMTTSVVSCAAQATAGEAQQLMVKHGIRHLPIIENAVPVGMISSRDVVADQLSTAKAMKAAAEQVANLTKGLKCLDLDELVDLATREVPKIFRAEWAVLCFPANGCPALDSPLIRRCGCPRPAEDLIAQQDGGKAPDAPQADFGDSLGSCERIGGKPPKLVIPLNISEAHGRDNRAPRTERGYLCICRLSSDSENTEELLHYTSGLLKDLLSTSLTNAALYQETRRRSQTDSLTGVHTRQLFEEKLRDECARARRYHTVFSLGMVDIDHFKEVNDRWGHGAGDRVLRDMAEIILQEARASDVCARYGGYEFILLMPGTRTDEAVVLLDRLRSRASTIFVPAGRITTSCGAAEWSGQPDEGPQDILRRVDGALYEAKRIGRDRVAVHSADPAIG